ncbi:MAG: S9 family peptidase [Saprospiraceae bacterium]|nr:S9 family peptidase [Saprospiraceae bacterium]
MKQPALIDREIFFGDPEISGAKLSPNGKWISFIKPYKGIRNIWVKKFNQSFAKATPVTADENRPITSYFWSRDSKNILYVQDKAGDENYKVYAVRPSTKVEDGESSVVRLLTDFEHVRVYIYAVARKRKNIIFLGINNRDASWHDLYALNISTGKLKLIRKNTKRIVQWIFNREDQLSLAVRSNEDGSTDFLRIEQSKYVPVYHFDVLDSAYYVNFHEDGRRIYLVTNKGEHSDLSQLILLNIHNSEEELVESDPEKHVDFGSAFFSEADNRFVASYYTDDRTRIYWKDKNFEKIYLKFSENFPGKEVHFTSLSTDENRLLVLVNSDRDCGSVYSYDRINEKLKFQYKLRPELDPKKLSEMQPIRYDSSDGLEIRAYLTLPVGVKAKKLPLVVNPHGGPWVRDYWGYNSLAQFLANRGYAVLQMNFRGSTGYGKKFLDAGNREWGGKMQDDITWGVKHLVAQGLVDASKVGIIGGSYGGYASLAAAAFTPDVFACAISKVGPSSLLTLLASIPPYWEAGRMMFHVRMGDPTTEEGKNALIEKSPLYSAEKIKCPLMIVQGANDPRVKKAESDQIVEAVHKSGKPVIYLCAPDEGHGFIHPLNNMAFLASAEKFLAQSIGGRYQEEMKDDLKKRLLELDISPKDSN